MKNMSLPIKWIHFGDGEFRDAFLTAAAELPDNVTLDFRGAVPNKAIIAYYQSSPVDLVLNVSEFEGIPVSLMEAISFGIPVAGCDVCGMPEIVTSKTGVLLPKELDCKETADVLSLFLKTKSRNPDVRKVVKSFWKERFNAANNYQKFTNHLIKCN
jgi:glycosyltransferase involved in cell wall biosynthesis